MTTFYEAKGEVFANIAEFSIGSYTTEAEAQKAINNFRYKFEMPANNWFIASFWIDKKEKIQVESKEIGEYDYED